MVILCDYIHCCYIFYFFLTSEYKGSNTPPLSGVQWQMKM